MTITYTAAYKTVRFDYSANMEVVSVATLGEVNEAELEALLAAEGGDVAGWSCAFN